MEANDLLREVGEYCREAGLAESTFGRLAVNDGKLVARLRDGGRITMRTLERVRAYVAAHPVEPGGSRSVLRGRHPAGVGLNGSILPADGHDDQRRNFRFFDNRQKYLLFVTTCGEKQVVATRVAEELTNVRPRPPAFRLFDAGVGDGTVLARVMRAMHARFPTMPFHVVGKEISLEDVRLTLDKLPDRFCEHPATVVVLTNMFYSEAPWLRVASPGMAASMVWHEVALDGTSSHHFEEQIADLQPFLARNWKAKASPKSGNPVYETPVVLVLYRQDHRFLLNSIIPRLGRAEAGLRPRHRLAALSGARWRRVQGEAGHRAADARARAGRPADCRSIRTAHDPGMEIINRIWPDENPFSDGRHAVLDAVKHELGGARRDFNFNAYSDHALHLPLRHAHAAERSQRADRHLDPVCRVERGDLRRPDRRRPARRGRHARAAYIDATAQVLHRHGGLWFLDESFVISRRRPDGPCEGRMRCMPMPPAAVVRSASGRSPAPAPRSRSRPDIRTAIDALHDQFDPGTEVYVNFLPNGDYRAVLDTATRLRRAGFRAGAACVGTQPCRPGDARRFPRAARRRGRCPPGVAGRRRPRHHRQGRSRRASIFWRAACSKRQASPPSALPDTRKATRWSRPRRSTQRSSTRATALPPPVSISSSSPSSPSRPRRCWLGWHGCVAAGIDLAGRASAWPARRRWRRSCGSRCVAESATRCATLRLRTNAVGRLLADARPDELLHDVAVGLAALPAHDGVGLHFFPFGGIAKTGAFVGETLSRLYGEITRAAG